MKYILSPERRTVLHKLAHERTLFGFDYDGTLAPIVDHPERAGMRDRTQNLLARLSTLYPCVILSGRARTDLTVKLKGVPALLLIGSHGSDTGAGPVETQSRIGTWKKILEQQLMAEPGVWVEDKGLSLAIHYRQSPRKVEARRRVLQVARSLDGAHVFGGKQVVNVVEEGAPNKGTALATERDRLQCDWVLFVGDDENDEEAFSLPGNTVAVRVGRKLRSKAGYYLKSQSEIDDLLEEMIRLRETPD